MENFCYICKNSIPNSNLSFSFSCKHTYCITCLYFLIFNNHIRDLNIYNFKIDCKCQEGNFISNLDKLIEIMSLKYTIDSSKNNNSINSNVCLLHNLEKNFFCKNCLNYICKECISISEHKEHNIIENEEYIKIYKNYLNGLPLQFNSLKNFLDNYDKILNDFYNNIENNINNSIKIIDDIIEILLKLKSDYSKKLKEKYDLSEKVLKILKMLYCNWYIEYDNLEEANDIFLLKNLKDIQYELININFIEDPQIFNNFEEIKNVCNKLNINNINIIDYNIEFKEIYRGFISIDKLFGHKQMITNTIQLQNGDLLSGSADFSMCFWQEKEGRFYKKMSLSAFVGYVLNLCQLKDGRILSSSRDNNTVRIWEKKKIKNLEEKYVCETTLSEHKEYITYILQLSDEKVITSSKDCTIKIWEIVENNNSFKLVQNLTEHKNGVYSLCEMSSNKFASSSDDMSIRIWEEKSINNFECIDVLNGHKKRVRCLTYLKDGRIASGSADQNFKIWAEKNNNFICIQSVLAHHSEILDIIQLKDGRLITCGKDSTIRVWQENVIKNGFVRKEVLREHKKGVNGVLELSDGRMASYGMDNVIIIWKNGIMFE